MTDPNRPGDENEPIPFGKRPPLDSENEPFDSENEPLDSEPEPFDSERTPFDEERTPFDDDVRDSGIDGTADLAAARDGDRIEDRERLELGDEDASLPWLDGNDDYEEERGGGGQILLLALLALSALVLIIGGIWWFSRNDGESELVADGSVIEAPAAPFKERPADPGGKTFEGTGDTSYAVSEGETRQVRLGADGEAPKPGFESVAGAAGAAGSTASASKAAMSGSASTKARAAAPASADNTATASAPAGPAVQVGAFSSRAQAEAAWSRLTGSQSALSGMRYRVVEAKADIGTVYRLQALPGDGAAARSLCAKLKAGGQDCTIKN